MEDANPELYRYLLRLERAKEDARQYEREIAKEEARAEMELAGGKITRGRSGGSFSKKKGKQQPTREDFARRDEIINKSQIRALTEKELNSLSKTGIDVPRGFEILHSELRLLEERKRISVKELRDKYHSAMAALRENLRNEGEERRVLRIAQSATKNSDRGDTPQREHRESLGLGQFPGRERALRERILQSFETRVPTEEEIMELNELGIQIPDQMKEFWKELGEIQEQYLLEDNSLRKEYRGSHEQVWDQLTLYKSREPYNRTRERAHTKNEIDETRNEEPLRHEEFTQTNMEEERIAEIQEGLVLVERKIAEQIIAGMIEESYTYKDEDGKEHVTRVMRTIDDPEVRKEAHRIINRMTVGEILEEGRRARKKAKRAENRRWGVPSAETFSRQGADNKKLPPRNS